MYIFDPTQASQFGYNFFQGDGFSYRYQMSKKLFFTTIYIPFGPNCESETGFKNFITRINKLKFTKVKIDLPAIYSSKILKNTQNALAQAGFKKSSYIQDEETLLVLPDDLNLKGKEMKKVRRGHEMAEIITKTSLTTGELDQIYKIYLDTAKNLSFKPKDKSTFEKVMENGLVTIAVDKQTKQIEGFLLNSIIDTELPDYAPKTTGKAMVLVYTGLSEVGRDHQLGHVIHYESFKTAFEKYHVDIADFHGASRTKNRTYIRFKTCFSERFFELPGSFEKINLL